MAQAVNPPTCVQFEVLTGVVMKSTIFWDITPCSPLKVNRRFGGTCRLHLQGCLPPAFTLVSCLVHSSILNMQANCSSENSGDFQRTIERYIPEDRTLLPTWIPEMPISNLGRDSD
jgi:hypothetical protein